mmetsp:Transcript_69025/g.173927  ORF Transcript_69025/g.173927 Transcript_69025/m.173927 type:complete len:278 (+) Transcript_69025:540-1373(+)
MEPGVLGHRLAEGLQTLLELLDALLHLVKPAHPLMHALGDHLLIHLQPLVDLLQHIRLHGLDAFVEVVRDLLAQHRHLPLPLRVPRLQLQQPCADGDVGPVAGSTDIPVLDGTAIVSRGSSPEAADLAHRVGHCGLLGLVAAAVRRPDLLQGCLMCACNDDAISQGRVLTVIAKALVTDFDSVTTFGGACSCVRNRSGIITSAFNSPGGDVIVARVCTTRGTCCKRAGSNILKAPGPQGICRRGCGAEDPGSHALALLSQFLQEPPRFSMAVRLLWA